MQYVTDFEFPAEQGFTGSAGKNTVKGYMRGGHVKKDPVKKAAQKHRAPGPGAAHGGSVHDKLRSEGEKMGYAYGGRVSNTSSEFLMKKKPMASMDSGVQPARKGRNQAEIEAGGTKRLKPKFSEGGTARSPASGDTSRSSLVKETARIAAEESQEREPTTADTKRKASGKGMPRNVRARGGSVGYAEGGLASAVEGAAAGAAGAGAGALARLGARLAKTKPKRTGGSKSAKKGKSPRRIFLKASERVPQTGAAKRSKEKRIMIKAAERIPTAGGAEAASAKKIILKAAERIPAVGKKR